MHDPTPPSPQVLVVVRSAAFVLACAAFLGERVTVTQAMAYCGALVCFFLYSVAD